MIGHVSTPGTSAIVCPARVGKRRGCARLDELSLIDAQRSPAYEWKNVARTKSCFSPSKTHFFAKTTANLTFSAKIMSSGNVFYDMNAIFLNFLIFDNWSVFNAVFSMQTGKLLTELFFRTKKTSFRCLFQEIEGNIIKNGVQSQKISQQFLLVPKRFPLSLQVSRWSHWKCNCAFH